MGQRGGLISKREREGENSGESGTGNVWGKGVYWNGERLWEMKGRQVQTMWG